MLVFIIKRNTLHTHPFTLSSLYFWRDGSLSLPNRNISFYFVFLTRKKPQRLNEENIFNFLFFITRKVRMRLAFFQPGVFPSDLLSPETVIFSSAAVNSTVIPECLEWQVLSSDTLKDAIHYSFLSNLLCCRLPAHPWLPSPLFHILCGDFPFWESSLWRNKVPFPPWNST